MYYMKLIGKLLGVIEPMFLSWKQGYSHPLNVFTFYSATTKHFTYFKGFYVAQRLKMEMEEKVSIVFEMLYNVWCVISDNSLQHRSN